MKVLDKLENLKNKHKFLILIIISALIFAFNALFYNHQILKIDKDNRNYLVDFNKKSEIKQINLKGKYVRELTIKYKTSDDFLISYNGEVANNYGVYKEFKKEETCYSYADSCGIRINQKVGILNIDIDSSDVDLLEISVNNSFYFNWVTFVFWFVLINLILVIVMYKSYFSKKLHVLTFLICASLGFLLLISEHNMTTTTLDDDNHYGVFNSLNKTSDETSVTNYYLENCFVNFRSQDTLFEKKNFQNFMNENSKVKIANFKSDVNLLNTNKINYLPLALLLKVLNIIGVKQTVAFFLGRVMQLLMYTIVISLAVKIMPNYKLLMMIIGILPQSIFLATNYSYDPTVTAFLLLAFSCFANEYFNKDKKIKKSNILIFIFAALYGAFPKAIYSPIILLMLLLPKEKFYSNKQYKWFRGIIVCLFILSMATFLLPLITDPSARADTRGGDTSSVRQLKLMFHCPISFIKTFWNEAILNTFGRLLSPVTLGQFSYYGSMGLDTSYFLFLISLIIAFVSEKKRSKILLKDKIIMILIYIFIICSIWGSMYLLFTPVGEATINGVQNRYFIPLLLPIIYCFSNIKLKSEMNDKSLMVTCSLISIIAITLLIYNLVIKMYCL